MALFKITEINRKTKLLVLALSNSKKHKNVYVVTLILNNNIYVATFKDLIFLQTKYNNNNKD